MKVSATIVSIASIFVVFSFLLGGCSSSSPIVMEQFGGVSDIPEGEEAFIYWTFANADYVRVTGEDKRYAISDRITVRPMATTNYRVTALRNDDSLAQDWTVNVYRSSKQQQSDPAGGGESASATSQINSGYFRGGATAPNSKPSRMKVIGFTPVNLEDKSFRAKALVYDDEGRFVSGKIREASEGEWYSRYSCSEVSEEHKASAIYERTGDVPPAAISIVLDRSFAMEEFGTAGFEGVKSFLNELSGKESASFAVFNQSVSSLIPLVGADSASIMADFLTAPPPEGLSALFRAADFAITSVENVENKSKAALIITAGTDNASVLFTAQDVIAHAVRANMPVYVIALGEAPQMYTLRHIAMKTGGRLYQLPVYRIAELPNVIREIAEGQTSYYDLMLPMPGNTQSCEYVTSTIVLPTNGTALSDKLTIFDQRNADAPAYQSVVLFADDDATIADEYKAVIKQLAATLRANPDKRIEVSGHSSLSNTDADATALASQRAQAVKRLLVANGVDGDKIRIRNVGNRKPVYYFEDTRWQAVCNRRADIRWLDPSLLPFEIIAQRVTSEEEALHFAEDWEKRGIKSYYERTMVRRSPMYTVKLWGYGTAEEAEKAAKFLSKQYKIDLQVE